MMSTKSFYGDGGCEWLEHQEKRGWTLVAAWGKDGWDMGSWPIVCVTLRDTPDPSAAVYVEGDVEVSSFASVEERDHYLDGIALYHWQLAGADWLNRPAEDLRGRYSAART